MKVRQKSVIKALFNVIAGCSFVALSACAQPVTQTPTTTVPPVAESPTTTGETVAQTPTTTVPPQEESPTTGATVTSTPTTTVPPQGESPTTGATVTPTPTTTIPTITASPTSASSNQNLARQLQSLASQGQLQTLAKAVQAAGLTDRLSAPGPYTLFAPSDTAFAALPKTTLDNLLKPANKQKLVQLLSYHIVPGRLTAAQLKSGQVKTLGPNSLTIKVDPTTNTVTVNGATVTQADISASNGIIHIVDQVLLPPKFKVTQLGIGNRH